MFVMAVSFIPLDLFNALFLLFLTKSVAVASLFLGQQLRICQLAGGGTFSTLAPV